MTIETFTLPKHDGTKYSITGTAVTQVMQSEGYLKSPFYPEAYSVIRLASGELVLYVSKKPIPRSNNYASVETLFRNAQNMTAEEVVRAAGVYLGTATHPVMEALNMPVVEEIS
jgi:hypothetical protein